jgi:hypothetical protein
MTTPSTGVDWISSYQRVIATSCRGRRFRLKSECFGEADDGVMTELVINPRDTIFLFIIPSNLISHWTSFNSQAQTHSNSTRLSRSELEDQVKLTEHRLAHESEHETMMTA